MRLLSTRVAPTAEQLKVIGDVRPGFRIIRGAAGSGKTTTALLRLGEQIRVRLDRRLRYGRVAPVRALVLTFNRTLEGYITELAYHSVPDDEALHLEISTFASWARSLVGDVTILNHRQAKALLRPHLIRLVDPSRLDFFIDEVFYTLGRFEPENLGDYLTVVREGRGDAPRVTRVRRAALLENVLPAYSAAKHERGVIDWNDLAVRAADAEADRLYDIVIVDEAQDFSANQVRAVLRHLQQPSHNTTFVLDAIQRIYPQYFKWASRRSCATRSYPYPAGELPEHSRDRRFCATARGWTPAGGRRDAA